jgi:hypothetical protein
MVGNIAYWNGFTGFVRSDNDSSYNPEPWRMLATVFHILEREPHLRSSATLALYRQRSNRCGHSLSGYIL